MDWESFANHTQRTFNAGLTPAVNMDTGYGNLIDEATRVKVLSTTQSIAAGKTYLAGAFVADSEGAAFNFEAYQRQLEQIQQFGATPIVFQSFGLAHQSDDQILSNYQAIANEVDRFYAFELGKMFAPFGNIFSLSLFGELMKIRQCIGAKHSSLRRDLEWERLRQRDQQRPDFQVLTGNDLAIDMVMYGSDYLLGLSTFCPDLFAQRDALWERGDAGFYQLNDTLQYLGHFAFRHPTSAYKHNAAMFLNGRGWIRSDMCHPKSPQRPSSDYAVLFEIGRQLGLEMKQP